MEKEITGDIRRYIVINTTDYNGGDGQFLVAQASYDELKELGIENENETFHINYSEKWSSVRDMSVGDILLLDEEGAYIMRVA